MHVKCWTSSLFERQQKQSRRAEPTPDSGCGLQPRGSASWVSSKDIHATVSINVVMSFGKKKVLSSHVLSHFKKHGGRCSNLWKVSFQYNNCTCMEEDVHKVQLRFGRTSIEGCCLDSSCTALTLQFFAK